ncbi:MAG: hypothetical protein GX567_11970 [Clostridia bacterium]|nr:hypothetical protein [Clostridia bacterium]
MISENVPNSERFTAFSCMLIWLIMVGLYIASGILSYHVMDPNGFCQTILWIIGWQILAAIIEFLFAAIIMWISSIEM